MKIVTLKRTHFSPIDGWRGNIDDDGKVFAVTLEDPKLCIKAGEYICNRDFYHKGNYETFEIIVPDRERILFHKGNTEADTLGCVLIGESYGELMGREAILDSNGGFTEFMHRTYGLSQIKLVVKEWKD
jgi:hypothetical protein